jgi:hypothetical protein
LTRRHVNVSTQAGKNVAQVYADQMTISAVILNEKNLSVADILRRQFKTFYSLTYLQSKLYSKVFRR